MQYDENDCILFYAVVRRRMFAGYSEEAIFAGKPRGFSIWLKKHYSEHGGVRLPKRVTPAYACWKCGTIYTASRCPKCGAFKPRT